MQKTKLEQLMERFDEEYRKVYSGTLSEEVLKKGNPWFEQFLHTAIEEVVRDLLSDPPMFLGPKEFLDEIRPTLDGAIMNYKKIVQKAKDNWGVIIK